ncbi:MAG: hypothetical protein DRZ76_02775 [Candidatus Nealsonbacteria bacterium]|nr:MAG: hypothetical protein DRZ76_02775 [Candidatus Nealsonbacteria bacterium]
MNFEDVVRISKKPEEEVKKEYAKQLEYTKNVIRPESNLEETALSLTLGALRRGIASRAKEYEALIYGISNKPSDYAERTRRNAQDFISRHGEDKAKVEGYINDDGQITYPNSAPEFKRGKPVPEHDYLTYVDAIIDIDGNPTYGTIAVPGLDSIKDIKTNAIMKFNGGNPKPKPDGRTEIRAYAGSTFSFVKDVEPNKVWETVKKYIPQIIEDFGDVCKNIDGGISMSFVPIKLKNFVVRNIVPKKDNSGYGLELETCKEDKYKTAQVWTGKLDFVPQAGLPINVYGYFSRYLPDTDVVEINARSVWYDKMFQIDNPKPMADMQKEW